MRYFESGRIAYFDQVVGRHLSQSNYDGFIKGKKVGPILKSASIKYLAPVEYPDTLTVGVRVGRETIGRDRFTQLFKAVSHKLGRVVAEGEAVIVTYDYENKKKADIPKAVLDAISKVDKI
ncbi:HotDog domain-containing protein [Chytridium lagenaria]|nr:HotDog domain-containing protein [Chytridium lagenaria]